MRITSASGKSVEVRLADSATIQDVLDAVALEWATPAAHHQLVFNGTRLEPSQTIKEAGIRESDEILLRGHLNGGCGASCNMCRGRMGAGCRCDIM